MVQPKTVARWHQAGFRLFWRWRSRHLLGRTPKDRELIDLIRRMSQANPTLGSPRIRTELAKLGLQVSTATVRKYRPKGERGPPHWDLFARPAEAAQVVDIAADKRFLLLARPAFELTLPLHGFNDGKGSLTIHQSRLTMVMGVFTTQTASMLAQSFGQVVGLANVERTIGRLQDVDPEEPANRHRAGNSRE